MDSKTLHFLSQLAENNNREWFQENKKHFEAAKADMEKLVGYLIGEVGKFEDLGNVQVKDCMLRIYRDVRFLKIKLLTRTTWLRASVRAGRVQAKSIITCKFSRATRRSSAGNVGGDDRATGTLPPGDRLQCG